jgi:phenylacetate-CoA ligase
MQDVQQVTAGSLKRHVLGELLVRRNPLYYSAARRHLTALEASGFEERRAWTHERLREVLHAARGSRYGREVGGTLEPESWPLLEKETLRDRAEAFLARRDWLAAPASTGGTTGIPLRLWRSLDGVAFEQACQDRLIEQLGSDPRRGKVAVLRGDNIKDPSDLKPPHWLISNGGRCMVFSSNVLMAETIEHYADALEEFQPNLLCAYPTSLECLCRLLNAAGRRLHIPAVLTSSEVLKKEAWKLARDTLGCEMADYYGQAERVGFAYAFEPRSYRFLPGYAYIELVPFGNDLAAGTGSTLHEIVGTSFWNRTMPLVRYRTGDLVRLPAGWGRREREEVTLGMRSFSGVMGREQEILVCPRGVRLTGIDHIPRDVRNVLRIQVVQESLEHVRILVLPGPGFSRRDADQLLFNARSKVPASMTVDVETAEWLERTPRGKTPLVIHRAPVESLLRTAGIEPSVTR